MTKTIQRDSRGEAGEYDTQPNPDAVARRTHGRAARVQHNIPDKVIHLFWVAVGVALIALVLVLVMRGFLAAPSMY